MKNKFCTLLVLVSLFGPLAACGGGGGGGFAPTPSSPGGLWQGTVTTGAATQNIFTLVDETGRFHSFQDDGVQYFGTLNVTGNRVSASFTGVPFSGQTFSDGSIKGAGTLSGTVQQRAQMNLTVTFTTAANTVVNASVTMQYSPDYEVDSALTTAGIAGNFTSYTAPGTPPATDSLNITTAGVLFYQDATGTGCVFNGTVSIIDARFDMYAVEFTVSSCVAPADVLNGLQVTGLASIDRVSSNPNLLLLAMHGTLQGDPLALLLPFNAT